MFLKVLALAAIVFGAFACAENGGGGEDIDVSEAEQRAVRAFVNEDYAEAVRHLDHVIQRSADRPMALRLRGEALMALGRYDAAADSLERSIERRAGDLEDYVYLALSLERLEERERAIEVLYEAIETLPAVPPQQMESASARFSPNEEELFATLADLLERSGMLDEAARIAGEGFVRNSGSARLFDLWMELLEKSGNPVKRDQLISKHCDNPLIQQSAHCNS